MKYSVKKEEWKRLTYVWRVFWAIVDVIWLNVVYRAMRDGKPVGIVVMGIAIGGLLLYWTYTKYRTPYFAIPMSRYYNAKILKESVESEEFSALKGDVIWESEHWLRIGGIFFPKNMICRLGGSVASGSIMTVTTIDRKVYTLHHMGHIERTKEEKIIGDTLPLVKLLNERGYDGQGALERQPCVSEEYISEMMTKYLENHSVGDMLLRTDIMEMYVKEYDRIKSGGRKKKEMAV